jgi:gas vesicle protein
MNPPFCIRNTLSQVLKAVISSTFEIQKVKEASDLFKERTGIFLACTLLLGCDNQNIERRMNMLHKNQHSDGIVAGVLIGASLGVAAGFLLAPKSGKALRSDLQRKGKKTFRKAIHLYSKAHEQADEILDTVEEKIERLRAEVDDVLDEAQDKMENLLPH